MLSISITLLLMALIIYYFRRTKRTEDISFDIRKGARCFSCKEKIATEDDYYDILLMSGEKEKFEICKCCKRDESIDLVVGKKRKLIVNKIKKYLISEKSRYIYLGLLYSLGGFLVLGVILTFTVHISIFGLTNFINILYWIIMIYKQKVSTIKKIPGELK